MRGATCLLPRRSSGLQIRLIETAADVARLRAGFREVFGGDISPAMLHWKYGEGRGRMWGAFADSGDLLAHCGVMYREVLAEGKSWRIAQLGDLLATPARLDGLSRKQSAFFQLIDTVLASVRDDRNPDALCFGFPSDRAMRLGERLGLFASIDQVHELTLQALPARRLNWWHMQRLTHEEAAAPSFLQHAQRLWTRMAQDLGRDLVGVRDAAYLRHRYLDHPEHAYVLCCVRPRWGAPVAWAALRKQGGNYELMDVVAAREHRLTAVQVLRRHLSELQGAALTLWLTQGQLKDIPSSMGFESVALQFRIMANPRSSGGDAQRFAGRWWLTSGDTDYR
ncbi:MAG: GNAT family N-acetyltransferase [Comamonadaceae bacterium]|nr:MAG: GNAT family N-acetyltransferase [Comamonadaceae bacterium]